MLNSLLAVIVTTSAVATACDSSPVPHVSPAEPAFAGAPGTPVPHVSPAAPAVPGAPGAADAPDPAPETAQRATTPTAVPEQAPAAAREPQPGSSRLVKEVRDESTGLLLTFMDTQGRRHVVDTVSAVPQKARSRVRVVFPGSLGDGEDVTLVDLMARQGDGAYKLSKESVSAWLERGEKKRHVQLTREMPELFVQRAEKLAAEKLAAKKLAAEKLAAEKNAKDKDAKTKGQDKDASKKPQAKKQLNATVYGAVWCKPCDKAAEFLKTQGVSVTKKDVEEDPAARAEMKKLLKKIGRPDAQIPIIDLNGKVLVGFKEAVLKKLLTEMQKPASKK